MKKIMLFGVVMSILWSGCAASIFTSRRTAIEKCMETQAKLFGDKFPDYYQDVARFCDYESQQ